MNDDTDKLAAQMRNLKPSKKSREAGLDAAMAAFSKEFSPETSTETAQSNAVDSTDIEKNSTSTQGSADVPRPTGKSTTTVRAKTRRVEKMAKIKTAFNFKPHTMMMAGTCSAALIAAMIVIPNMDDLMVDQPQVDAVVQSAEVKAPVGPTEAPALKDRADVPARDPDVKPDAVLNEVAPALMPESIPAPTPEASVQSDEDVVVVTGGRRENIGADAPEPKIQGNTVSLERFAEEVGPLSGTKVPETTAPANIPNAGSGITSVDTLLNDIRSNSSKAETENRARVQHFRQSANQQAGYSAPAPAPVVAPQGRTPIATPGADKPMSAAPEVTRLGNLTLEEGPAEFKTITETVVVQEASTELVVISPTFETVTETIVVQPQSVEYVVQPAEYEWVEGDVEGSEVEYVPTPPVYETVSETVVVQEASTELVTIPATYETVQETIVVQEAYQASDGSNVPAVTKEVSRRVVKTPARTSERTIPSVSKVETRRVVKTPAFTVERVVPFEKKDGKTRVPVKPSTVIERTIPPVTKEVSRRVIKTPASTQERTVPNVGKTITRRVMVKPQKYVLRDDDGNVVREFENRDAFEKYKSNLTTVVSETPVSTFSVDVDTASYSFLRASVNRGQLPPRASIRLEEMINYFPYDYEAPKSADTPFKANVTVTPTPWNTDTKLMHIGIKGYVPTQTEKPRSNLVFLIDTSGSMNRANKLPLLINSFKLLLNTLDDDDTVSIVAYASASGTVLEPTPVKDKDEILSALNRLRAGGSTAGAAGLELAYQKAQESFDDEGVNRVILATDGDFNVGFSSPDDMKAFIKEKRETGIFLSVLGFGMGNYNDHLMQSLAQNGNGVAAYIDSLAEANKVLANEAGSALFTIAKDVKIQVEFNPATVAEYRLIGYETRALNRQDFNNDKVDAGEIGAGHTVTAIYEMTPVDSPAVTVDNLRYVSDKSETVSEKSDELAFVKIRHKLPNADKSTLQTFPIGKRQEKSLRRAGDDMRFAAAVAAVGQKLRGDIAVEDYSFEDAIKLAQKSKGEDENGYRAEFIQMVKLIDTMSK